MMFEFFTCEGRDTYKLRRRNLDAYEQYRNDGPHLLFAPTSGRIEYSEPREQEL